MLAVAAASRQHWVDANGTDENLAVADWQVAHTASLAGFADVALSYAKAAVDRAGQVLSGDRPPTSELALHLAAYAATGTGAGAGAPNSPSTRFSSTAFTATMIEDSDISSADHCGASMMPNAG